MFKPENRKLIKIIYAIFAVLLILVMVFGSLAMMIG